MVKKLFNSISEYSFVFIIYETNNINFCTLFQFRIEVRHLIRFLCNVVDQK